MTEPTKPMPVSDRQAAFEASLFSTPDVAPDAATVSAEDAPAAATEEPVAEKPTPVADIDDFDAPLVDEPIVAEPSEDPEVDPIDKIEDPAERESFARKEAKRRGGEAKALKAEKADLELRLAKAEEERQRAAAELEELRSTKINPREHPDFVRLQSEIMSDVEQAAEVLVVEDPNRVIDNFGRFMVGYLGVDALKGAERTAALERLRGEIVDTVIGADVPYAEMDADERRQYAALTTDVLKIVQRNVGKTRKLQELDRDLSKKAKTGTLALGVKEYEERVKAFSPVLDAVGDLADDVIEANPNAVASIVAKTVKTSKAAAQRLATAKRDLLDIFVGPRALTQDEIDKLEANGEDPRKFMIERDKAINLKRQRYATMTAEAVILRPLLADALAKLAKYEAASKQEERELDALESVTKPRPGSAPAQPAEKRSEFADWLTYPGQI